MKGNFNSSLKLANEKFGYKTPEEPGTLPRGILINGDKYILIPIAHTAVCDSKGCQSQCVKFHKENPNDKKYTTAPIYSNWGRRELCIVCADIENTKPFIPTKDETNRMLEILGNRVDEMSDDECESDEGDECDTTDEEIGYEICELKV